MLDFESSRICYQSSSSYGSHKKGGFLRRFFFLFVQIISTFSYPSLSQISTLLLFVPTHHTNPTRHYCYRKPPDLVVVLSLLSMLCLVPLPFL